MNLTIEDFEIIRELGRGGMGVVYEALEKPLNRRVALKVLHPEWASQQESSARFLEEAKKIARLSHQGIVRIHRFGRTDNSYFLALELVDGSPLDAILAKERLSVLRSIQILIELATALGHAHAADIVHRDIKPGNVFVRPDGSIVLGDFGIAKDIHPLATQLTRGGDIIGTPAYMSPEQALGEPISPATDVYSLGVVSFELIAGRPPFTADTAIALLMKHVQEPPPALADVAMGVPFALADLIRRMLEKSPTQRPHDGNEVARLLTTIKVELEPATGPTEIIHSESSPLDSGRSYFEELEITLSSFELAGFSRNTCENLLPGRAAFLLESWYRLVRQVVSEHGGVVDRYVADRVTAIFGYPHRYTDHPQRAVKSAMSLHGALTSFNRAHDLDLHMRAGIACGPALVGRIVGDNATTSVQGSLPSTMKALSKSKSVEAPIRLNRAAYRRTSSMATFTSFDDPIVGEAWAMTPDE